MIWQWERGRVSGWWPLLFYRGVCDLTSCNSGVLRLKFKSFLLLSVSPAQACVVIALSMVSWWLLPLPSAVLRWRASRVELRVLDPSLAGEFVHPFPSVWDMTRVWEKVWRSWGEQGPRAGTWPWRARAEGVDVPDGGYFSVSGGHEICVILVCCFSIMDWH